MAPAAAVGAAPAADGAPRALRMASACGFGGAAGGFCAKAATSAALCGFCAGAVVAFCSVARMAAACGFGAGGGCVGAASGAVGAVGVGGAPAPAPCWARAAIRAVSCGLGGLRLLQEYFRLFNATASLRSVDAIP